MPTSMPEPRVLSVTDARNQFKNLLDTSDHGGLTVITRRLGSAAVVNATRYRDYLMRNTPANAGVVNEDGAWAVFLPGLPIAAEGGTWEEAIQDCIDALREYAADWQDHLHSAPNHSGHWDVVQIVEASNNQQLTNWVTGASA